MNKKQNELKLNYVVRFIPSHWDERKEDTIAEYWQAYIVSGLESVCINIKPKDLIVFYPGLISHTSAEDAIDKLVKELQQNNWHGSLHKITEDEELEYLESQRYID